MTQEITVPVRMWPRGLERLQAEVIDAERRLEVLKTREDPTAPALARCRASIERAKEAAGVNARWIRRRREHVAWDCLAQFDREVVHLLRPGELAVLWESVKAEADDKLKDHRKKAVQELVKREPTPEVVAEVLRHLHVTAQNMYHKIDRLNEQIRYAALFLAVLVAALLVGASWGAFAGVSETLDRTLVAGTLLGLTGGVLSLAFTVVRTDTRAKIPAMRESIQVARIRPLIGAAVALPVILIFESEVITVPTMDKKWLIPVACFLAGFSERWFLGLVGDAEKGSRRGSEGDAT